MYWPLPEVDHMKIAIPVQGDHVATVFDGADELLVIEKGPGSNVPPLRNSCSGATGIDRVALLKSQGVDVLICGALSGFIRRMIEVADIRVVPFIRGPVEEVVEAFCNGGLDEQRFFLPGCCPGLFPVQRRRRRRGGCVNRR
jgi:predicted Fe-Mo cluster-binding NifX family protein